MTSNQTEEREEKSQETEDSNDALKSFLRPSLKFVLGLAFLYVAEFLTRSMEATSEVQFNLPNTPEVITVQQIIHSVVTILTIVLIMKYGSDIGGLLKEMTGVTNVKRIALTVSSIVSLAVLYWMSLWIVEIYSEYRRYYDVGFLVVGLIMMAILVISLYRNIDRI